MTAPDRIWAWTWNQPFTRWHGEKVWTPFKPFWKKPITRFVSTSRWNPFAGRMEVCEQAVTEYVRADLVDPAAIREAALREAAEIARDFEANGVCGIQKCTGGMIRKQILALIQKGDTDDRA